MPSSVDIAIVGAGPHALTLATHLLQKRRHIRSKFLVFDPSGTWMHQWQHQFAALEIPHLRSPAVHHPDPDSYALRRFAETRSSEFYPPYDRPGTQLFYQFCQDVIRRWQLADKIVAAAVTHIEPIAKNDRPRFRLQLDDDRSIVARRVVLATGSQQPNVPQWVDRLEKNYPRDRLCHSHHLDLRTLQLRGERILIVGGGLTAGHLAVGALNRQARVALMHRRGFREQLFDTDPGWLGPKCLKEFDAEPDWQQRWHKVRSARDGGSLTPEMQTQLRRRSRSGQLEFYERCQVVRAAWQGDCWHIDCDDGTTHQFDRLWLATGTTADATADPLLSAMREADPVPIVEGCPVLDPHLRWGRSELFLMGRLAALQVGPVAGNLAGAKMACDRIVPALTKASIARSASFSF